MKNPIRSYETLARKNLPIYSKLSYNKRLKYLYNQTTALKKEGINLDFKANEVSKDAKKFNNTVRKIKEKRLDYRIEKVKPHDQVYYHTVQAQREKEKGNELKSTIHKRELAVLTGKKKDTIRRYDKKIYNLQNGIEKQYVNRLGFSITRQEKRDFDSLVSQVNEKRKIVIKDLKKENEVDHALVMKGLQGLNGREDIESAGFNVLREPSYYKTSDFFNREDFERAVADMEKFLSASNYVEAVKNAGAEKIFNKINASVMNRKISFTEGQELRKLINEMSLAEFDVFSKNFWKNVEQFDSGGNKSKVLGEDFESYFEYGNAINLIKLAKNDVKHYYRKVGK